MKNRNFLLLVLGLIVISLLYVRTRYLVVELSYQVNEKMAEKRALDKKKRELNLELSLRQSPRKIEEKARDKFALSYNNTSSKKIFMKAKNK